MNAKKLVTFVLLAFVAVSVGYLVASELRKPGPERQTTEIAAPASAETLPAAASPVAAPAHKVIAYYFHNTQRCMTCRKIEELAEAALREQFAAAFAAGTLEWCAINMEESPNTHFVDDYELVTSSVVLVDMHDGEQRAWVNLDKVWQLVHGEEVEFKNYIAVQARKYLES